MTTTNGDRSARYRVNLYRSIRACLRSGAALTCIAGADLTSKPRRNIAIMNAPTPPTNPAASDPDKLAQIASILGVSADDPDALEAAFAALIDSAPSADDAAATRQLSVRERAMCAAKRISPAEYLASRNRVRGGGR